jgi:sugar/nucleoside kinase (ribokinase family)
MSLTERVPGRWHPGRITVVGNPGLDTLVVLAEDDPDLAADGHFVRNVDTVGHAAAFTARAAARLGHDTRILGSTGAT